MYTKTEHEAIMLRLVPWVSSLAPWKIIGHWTFRGEFGLGAAQRAYEKFMNREVHDVSYFYAIEENPSRDGYHVHSLLADCEALQRSTVWQRWFHRFGRARIEPVNNHDDVVNYCAKYVCKEGAWWNVKLVNPDLWHKAAGNRKTCPGSSVDASEGLALQQAGNPVAK